MNSYDIWRCACILACATLLAGCSSALGRDWQQRPAAGLARRAADVSMESAPAGAAAAEASVRSEDRAVLYEADYQILVPAPREAGARFLAHAESLGGRLASRSLTMVEVRIPVDRFHALLEFIPGLGQVISESVSAQDVTDTIIDLELRIRTARSSHDRLLALLQKTDDVEEILAVEKEIRRLVAEIEALDGQLKQLGDRVAFSRVFVNFRAIRNTAPQRPRRGPSRFWWINRLGVESFHD